MRGDMGVTSADVIRVRVTVTGLVQGVGFRYFTVMAARRLGLAGWVRNRLDGSVEAEAQGGRAAVAEFVSRLKVGPRWARVERVRVETVPVEAGARGDLHGFAVLEDRAG